MRYVLIAAVLSLFGCSNPDDGKTNNGSNDPNNTSTNNANNTSSNNTSSNASNNANNTSNNGGADMGSDMSIPESPCPGAIPDADTACDREGLQCEYGDDPRAQCRNIATCDDDLWRIDERFCDPLPDTMCPMTRDDASGMDCDAMEAYCAYGDLVCRCTNCTVGGPVEMCGGDPTWKCDVPNTDSDCPAGKPRLGTGCDADGKLCEYECGSGGARVCRSGVWNNAEGGPCPMSTAKVKRDIRYLSAEELAQVSAALQRIPLAHYEYTDPSIGRGEKLGFIIEDLPAETPAVDRQRMMVDLYGYTSMLVADAQAREKRMKALEARLAELEARTAACTD